MGEPVKDRKATLAVAVGVTLVLLLTLVRVLQGDDPGGDAKQPSEPERLSESSAAYQQAILKTFNEMADSFDDISHVSLDGSVLDVHYARRVTESQFRQDASLIALSFSKKKKELLGVSHVMVRCVFEGRIFAQARAGKGKVTDIRS